MFPARAQPLTDAPNRPAQALLMLALFAMTCVLFFARVNQPLLEPEEARYAEIPRQMLEQGRYLTPVLHGEDYWQKPPLLYWLVMACFRVVGTHDWSARLVPCFAGILSVVITTGWAWRTLGFWTGLVSGAILALSTRFLYLAGMLTMDGVLCTCVLVGLAAGHLALTDAAHRWKWLVVSAFACALGVLTKGPVAVVLVGVPLVAFAWLDRRSWHTAQARTEPSLALQALSYLAIVAFVAGPWFIFMACQAPDAAGTFFWLHNLTRYVAPFDHEKPAWFYVPSLLLGMLPWTILVPAAIYYLCRRSARARRRRPAALGVFVLAFLWCMLFFSASGCKRQGYILPAFPLLALILGTFVTHGLPWRRWMATTRAHNTVHRLANRLTITTCVMGVTIALAIALAALRPWHEVALPTIALTLVALIVAARPVLPNRQACAGCVAVVFGVVAFAQLSWLPVYHERFAVRRQVALSAEHEQEDTLPIVTFPKRWDSIHFYTRRTDIASYAREDLDRLIRDVHAHGRTLIFVRQDESLRELRQALPAELELELLSPPGTQVLVGLVRQRAKATEPRP